MVEIGNKPILWHLLKMILLQELMIHELICCIYKGYIIKEYFANYYLHNSDVTFDLKNNTTNIHQSNCESWEVTLVDTGEETMTGGRLKKTKKLFKEDDTFCFTYGDGK